MPGFPARIARSSLGPTLQNRYPIKDPRFDIGEEAFNLAWWQIAGMNAVSPRGFLVVDGLTDAGVSVNPPVTTYQAFAWDPENAMPKIQWTRSGTGIYTFSLPDTQYPDEQGNLITVEFLGGVAFAQCLSSGTTGSNMLSAFNKTGVRSGRVRFVTTGGVDNDADFILLLW